MATYASSEAAAGYPVTLPPAGLVAVALGTYEIASALSQNDIVQMVRIPAGCRIVGGWLRGDDIDTGTEALELDVGTSSDADALLNSGVITGDAVTGVFPEGKVHLPFAGKLLDDGYLDTTDETVIQVTVTAAANAGGTGTISVCVFYTQKITAGS